MPDQPQEPRKTRRPVRTVGHGPIHVIVSHGWIADHSLFAPMDGLIDPDRFTYVQLDCPGYGSRMEEAGPYSIAGMAADVVATADALGWLRFHVIGHSMGGMVAQRLMIDLPERIASVVLLAPVPASGAKISDARRELLLRAIHEPAARRVLIDANTGHTRPGPWLDQVLALSLRSTRPVALEGYMDAWTGTDFSGEVRANNVPMLLILGTLDPGAPRARMEETILRWYPQTKVAEMPGIGHYPMQEDPAALDALLTQHFARFDSE